MLKVTGGVMPAALSLLPVSVSAAAGDEEARPPVNLDDLSLYTAPERGAVAVYAEPEAGQLEQSVAALRKLLEPYYSWCQDNIKPRVERVVRCGSDVYGYLQKPPKDFYPRAGVIGFSGVLGLLLARSSRAKRLLYPAGLMTLSASLYYPEQAARIARSTRDSVYDRAVQSYAAAERMMSPQREGGKAASSSEAKG